MTMSWKHYLLWFIRYYHLVSKHPRAGYVGHQLSIETRQLVTYRLAVNGHVLN